MSVNANNKSAPDAAKLWQELCQAAPALISARALKADGSLITSSWSQRDVIAGRKRTLLRTHVRTSSNSYTTTPPIESRDAHEWTSPSGKRTVRFEAVEAGTLVEIWSTPVNCSGALESTWIVPAKLHGPVFTDEWFGGVAWSPDEQLFIYVADRATNAIAKNGGTTTTWIEDSRVKFDDSARDTLGEGYISQRSPALFLADTSRNECRAICDANADADDDESRDLYGDPQWSKNGRLIAVTRRPATLLEPALEDDSISDNPYTLGVRYCYNRYSAIELFAAPKSLNDAADALSTLTPASNHAELVDFCCYSPRFTPDSTRIIYISAPRSALGRTASASLPHNTTKLLRGAAISCDTQGDIRSTAPVTILDVVNYSHPVDFPGLYVHALPARPWCGAGDTLSIITASVWGSEARVIGVPIGSDLHSCDTKSVVDATPAFPHLSCRASVCVLDVCEAGAVLAVSTPVDAPMISFSPIASTQAESLVPAITVTLPSQRARKLKGIARSFASVDLVLTPSEDIDARIAAREWNDNTDEPSTRFQATLLIPTSATPDTQVPLIVYPHGGPHVSTLNSYNNSVAFLLSMNQAVLHVNYRGSLGLGHVSLTSLPGHAGTQDVNEVLQATQWALQSTSLLDKTRVGYVGGSHAGFLGAHISSIPDNMFKMICLRNPVVNVASMSGVTDIPDWTFCESGASPVSTSGVRLSADPHALSLMWKISPVARVSCGMSRVTRTVLYVGGRDRRVPPSQSVEWKRVVTEAQGAGIVTMRWYPESGHAIDEVPCGDDVWVHTMEMLAQM